VRLQPECPRLVDRLLKETTPSSDDALGALGLVGLAYHLPVLSQNLMSRDHPVEGGFQFRLDRFLHRLVSSGVVAALFAVADAHQNAKPVRLETKDLVQPREEQDLPRARISDTVKLLQRLLCALQRTGRGCEKIPAEFLKRRLRNLTQPFNSPVAL